MKRISRRSFLQTAAGASLAFPFIGWKSNLHGAPPSKDVRVAAFGANGRAFGDITGAMSQAHTTLVAVAEIDEQRTGKVREKFTGAKIYRDWRELLEKEAGNIDVAVVGTPDHMHAPISMGAMQLGKHVYCEKPLTRTLHEARALRDFAADNHLITQMGNQLASSSGNRTTARVLQSGTIGKVTEVHSMNPKSWGSMKPLGEPSPVPEGLDWDGWIGVGKMRPYITGEFHPGQWRKRIGFGTGTLGDMACHIVHPWIMGLNSPLPLEVTSVGAAPVDEDSWPLNGKVVYKMAGNKLTKGDFAYTWYDGDQIPSDQVAAQVGGRENVPQSGSIIIGTKGAIAVNHGRDPMPRIYRNGELDTAPIEPAQATHHHGDFIDAVRGEGSAPVCSFDYSGPMTETVLLGTVAIRCPGETLKWNAEKLRFENSKRANRMVHDSYRKGWEVKGI